MRQLLQQMLQSRKVPLEITTFYSFKNYDKPVAV